LIYFNTVTFIAFTGTIYCNSEFCHVLPETLTDTCNALFTVLHRMQHVTCI